MKINFSIIYESTINGNLLLLKYLYDVEEFPKDILFLSVRSGNFELVKYILRKGIDINAKI